jgi:subtilisin
MCFGSRANSAHRRIACWIAASRKVLLIAAAGNKDSDKVDMPALYDTVISVGAIDQNKKRCRTEEWGSNYGEDVDIFAPGIDILSTDRNGGYSLCWGTSAAAAYVAGVALLWYGARAASMWFPHVKNEPIKCRKALFENAEYLGVNYGHGLVNAYKTVKDARGNINMDIDSYETLHDTKSN